jgi:DNA-directed RNA polymerase specialized sigma24 family protein
MNGHDTSSHPEQNISTSYSLPVEPLPKMEELAPHLEELQDRIKLDAAFEKYLRARSESGDKLFGFLKFHLRNFGLQTRYSEAYILNEAYIRSAGLIDKGETIHNLSAWLKQTSYNIMRELNRQQWKTQPFDDHLTDKYPNPVVPEEDEKSATLRKAFQKLDEKDQHLLELKVNQDLPWKQIQAILSQEWGENPSQSALRKRKERALLKLRRLFDMIQSESK